jgi:hypothetical protein
LDLLSIGLGVNSNLMKGEGPSFSTGLKGMSLHRLMMEYKAVRDKFENWIIHKFFEPIAEKNDFSKTVNGERKLILPEISWNKSLDIEDQEAEREAFVKMHERGIISTETLFTKFPSLDFKTEQKKLELERGTIFDKGDERLPAKITKGIAKPKGDIGEAPIGGAPGAIRPIPPIRPEKPGEGPGVGESPEAPTAGETAPAAPAAPTV